MAITITDKSAFYDGYFLKNQALPASAGGKTSTAGSSVPSDGGIGGLMINFDSVGAISASGVIKLEILGYNSRSTADSDTVGNSADKVTTIEVASADYRAGETIKSYIVSPTDGDWLKVRVEVSKDLSTSNINVYTTSSR